MRFLTGADVATLVEMDDVTDAVEEAYRLLGTDAATDAPRENVRAAGLPGSFKSLPAAADGVGAGGFFYTGGFPGEAASMTTLLFSPDDGGLVACIESDRLSWLRTGATSAVATDHCARADADTLGLLGSGKYARSQLTGVAAVRDLSTVRVYSPTRAHRERFAAEMDDEVVADVVPTSTSREAVADADVVCTATTADAPVFDGADLASGAHVNAIGSHYPDQREVDDRTVERARVIADSLSRARKEEGELLLPAEAGRFDWDEALELGAVVAGDVAGRTDANEVTLFTSGGLGVEYLLVGREVYDRAVASDTGTTLNIPMEGFV